MFVMGLTGNISCGKSSVSKMLASRGAIIVDADLLSREIYEYDDVLEEMKLSFPEALVNGKVDRRVLAGIVFSDKTRLEDLNRISHKKIYELVCQSLERNRDRDLVVIDAALLLEAKFDSLADKVVLVYCNEKVQLDRLMKRDSISSEDALKRIRSQMSQEDKKKMADYLIDNSGDLEGLENEVEKLIKEIRKWKCEGEIKE
ncbi:dephospho-CoA kinase [Peptostreptococcus sp.]